MHTPLKVREFALVVVAAIAAAAVWWSPASSMPERPTHLIVSSPQGFVAAFRFNPKGSAFLEETSRVRILSSGPSRGPLEVAFLAATSDGLRLYAAARPVAAQASNVPGIDSCIVTLSFDPVGGRLAELGRVASKGERPTHLALDRNEEHVLAVNNESNSISVFPRDEGGLLQEATQTLPTGVGPHQAVVDPSGRFVFVPNRGVPVDPAKGSRVPREDLPGSNTISQFVFSSGVLTPNTTPSLAISAGINPAQNPHPRHMAFHRNGKWAYVCNALNDTVTLLALDHGGALSEHQSVWSVPEGLRNKPPLPYRTDPAEISVDPSGRFLYVSSGAASSIAIFRIGARDGRLKSLGFVGSGGERPRHFSLDPTGSWLVVGNDRSNRLVLFRVDPASGGLKETASLDFPAPWCQVFVPGGKQGTSGFE